MPQTSYQTLWSLPPAFLAQSDDTAGPGLGGNGNAATQPGGDSQGGAATTQNGANDPAGGQGGGGFFSDGGFGLVLVIILVGVMWVFLLGGQRKEKKKRQKMLEALGKGQRVQTVGGILGTVVEMRDEEVIVKVDENANTRLRFAKSAIQNVFESEKDTDNKAA